MDKSKYIKVTDKDKKTNVVLASNLSFYQSQGYEISEPTDEDIAKYFPTEKIVIGTIEQTDTSEIEAELEKATKALSEEKSGHDSTKNLLTKEQDDHKTTKAELEKATKALNEAKTEIEKLNKKA